MRTCLIRCVVRITLGLVDGRTPLPRYPDDPVRRRDLRLGVETERDDVADLIVARCAVDDDTASHDSRLHRARLYDLHLESSHWRQGGDH